MSKPDDKSNGGRKPQTKPKPRPNNGASPRASVVPRLGAPMFGRPIAGTPSQRAKRINGRRPKVSGTITAKTMDNGEAEMLLFGTIGEDFWGDGITAKGFNESLDGLGNLSRLHLRINSGGGDVFEATAIYNMLVKHSAHVIVEIEGVAASAATLIAMAADEIHISENAHFMIHRASGIAWGNADALQEYLKLLNNADSLLRLTYSRRTGLGDAELAQMMSFDNWMTGQEAYDNGFADYIDGAKSVDPHVTPNATATAWHRPAAVSRERLTSITQDLIALAASCDRRIGASVNSPGNSPQPVTPITKDDTMSQKMRAKCVAAGMSATLSDADANKWLDDNFEKVMAAKAEVVPPVDTTTQNGNGLVMNAEQLENFLEAREQRRVSARKTWRTEVDANLKLAFGDTIPTDLKDDLYKMQDDGIEAVREKICEARSKGDSQSLQLSGRVNLSQSQPRDRHLAAIRTGLQVRCLSAYIPPEDAKLSTSQVLEKHLPEKDRPKDWEQFANMSLPKLAEESLLADGVTHEQLRRMAPAQIAQAALGFGRAAGLSGSALHTTGSLGEVTRDAMHKSLAAGYGEAPQTWRGPMRQGASVADFKEKHVVKLSAAGNLPVWNDNTAPDQVKLSNERESYAVEARAETLSFSWRLLLNDDLDALARHPQLLGAACGRTVNAVAWRQLTSNPVMADGQTLLLETVAGNRKRSNYTYGAATPTNAILGAMKAKMRLMRGLNTAEGNESEDVLNLVPAYLVGPAALEEAILKQVLSGADPAAGGNSSVYNTARTLTPVIEPLLDASSATQFYLFASTSQIDTIEVTFMQGYETPFPHEWMDDKTMSQNFTIIQVFEAKAIDHRGIHAHRGS
jgi:ATP-dependent Clp protease protease subunit